MRDDSESRLVHSGLNLLEDHAPLWVATIRAYLIKLERRIDKLEKETRK